ncbi:MAG TPA: two-component regulator propeller domain-containing protein [Chitinophagaceae bacterium]
MYRSSINSLTIPIIKRLLYFLRIGLLVVVILLAIDAKRLWSQQLTFHLVPPPEDYRRTWIVAITQDVHGYIWYASAQGLTRFDGLKTTHYLHDPSDSNSLSNNNVSYVYSDSRGIIWVATAYGLDKFDPINNVFTHFKFKPEDKTSLINDPVTIIIEDHENNIWLGSHGGLKKLDRKTGRLTHYKHDKNDPSSLSNDHVRAIYVDKQGILWVGTGSPFVNDKGVVPDEGGLNRFDRKTGKFVRFVHDPKNPHSLVDNRIRAIFEDSRGTFWVGTGGDGLHSLNRATGVFTRHLYDPAHPQKLSRPPVRKLFPWCDDHITFITEDASGALWIGTFSGGLNRYDPVSKKVTFFGWQEPHLPGGFNDFNGWCAFTSKDGVLWISTMIGNLFRVDPLHHNFHYYELNEDTQAAIEDSAGTIWIGTETGLIKAQKDGRILKKYVHDPHNVNSISNNYVNNICIDPSGKFWISTYGGGFNYFDPSTEKFTRFQHDPENNNSLINNTIVNIYADRNQNVWIGTDVGLDKMEINTRRFTHYKHNPDDTTSLISDGVTCFMEDGKNQLWIGCTQGINLLDNKTGKFRHYLKGNSILNIFEDASGTIWTSTFHKGLFRFDPSTGNFISFINPNTGLAINNVLSITEDNKNNLWLFGIATIMKLNAERDELLTYGKDYGVRRNQNGLARSLKGPSGNILVGDQSGYYTFFPDSIIGNHVPPQVVITDFYLGEQLVKAGNNSPLKVSVSDTKEIRLNYRQNVFSFDFTVLHYSNPENNQHLFMLENYDDTWRNSGTETKAFYFNVPPGRYTFRIKGSNPNGVWAERSVNIIITPPWWQMWWFWMIAGIFLFSVLYLIIKLRVRFVRKQERVKAAHEKELLELEAKALRAQMNPHFIFNCLNAIKSVIQNHEDERAVIYLTIFSKLIRTLFNNADKRQITLYDEIETCKLYLQLESMRFDEKFSYQIDIDETIDLKSIGVPALIIQPFIENAIWHGIMPKGSIGNVMLVVSKRNGSIEIIIEDDGIGRESSQHNKAAASIVHQSKGVNLTQSRLELDNLLNQRQAKLDIIDKKNEEGKAIGTRVIVTLPLED